MDADAVSEIFRQHVDILTNIDRIWIALVTMAFIGLLAILAMVAAAAWSVRSVNKRQLDLEAKFTLLIDVLLQQTRRDIEAKHVAVRGELVEVAEEHGH